MTLFTPSTLWEATDDELRSLMRAAQNELILRHMDKPVSETLDTPLFTETYGGWMTHLRQCCCIFTKQTCWTDGVIYMNALRWAGHARRDALIESNDKLLNNNWSWKSPSKHSTTSSLVLKNWLMKSATLSTSAARRSTQFYPVSARLSWQNCLAS